jgi:hypothetical protein
MRKREKKRKSGVDEVTEGCEYRNMAFKTMKIIIIKKKRRSRKERNTKRAKTNEDFNTL